MNPTLFQTMPGALPPPATARNEAGGKAYALEAKHALAQYAATGCLNGTYYASEGAQLKALLDLAFAVDAEFLAKTAIWCRERGFMKDTPAVLLAVLSWHGGEAFKRAFPRVVDDGRMLRNFVQAVRSGVTGRKSLGSLPKKLAQQWLEARDGEALFKDAIGTTPSLADVIRMVHPRPATAARRALYAYLLGLPHDPVLLPDNVRAYEAWKADRSRPLPDVPFQYLASLELSREDWKGIARRAPWQITRMNLNTFARHGVFDEPALVKLVAARLADPAAVKRSRVFPYQLLAAYCSVQRDMPRAIVDALHDAMELALANVPEVDGRVWVLPDVSGSMQSPVTGHRGSATTVMRCIDVAALVAAAIVRKNRRAEVLPFEHQVAHVRIDPRDSVLTNARRLASIGGGGTSCSAPLAWLNARKAPGDLVVYVSDNESWADTGAGRATATMAEWEVFKTRNPRARMVCIDLQPYATVQAPEREDILHVGGFGDEVFRVIAAFAQGAGERTWVEQIEAVALEDAH